MSTEMQDGIQKGLAKNSNLSVFLPDTQKINQIAEEYRELYQKYENINQKEQKFDNFISQYPVQVDQFTIWGIVTLAALVFDFIINSQTLSWLPSLFGQTSNFVYLWSFIFLILDIAASITASGLLAKNKYEYEKQRNIWLFILWSLCIIKIILFAYFALTNPDKMINSNFFYLILMIAFTVLVYLILHFGGAGLYHLIRKTLFWIEKEIFADYKNKRKQYINKKNALKNKISRMGNNPEEVFKLYPINDIE